MNHCAAPLSRRGNGSAMIVAALSAALLSTGCTNQLQTTQPQARDNSKSAQPTPAQVRQMIDPNVVGVAAFYDPFNPWLWTEDHGKPRGLLIRALYLQGSKGKGVFGDGTIRPKLYVREIQNGQEQWQLAKEWSYTVDQAMNYRTNREFALGWGYRLGLPWGDLNLAGREVRIIVEFERNNGQIVASDKKDFLVPGRNSTVVAR